MLQKSANTVYSITEKQVSNMKSSVKPKNPYVYLDEKLEQVVMTGERYKKRAAKHTEALARTTQPARKLLDL